LYDTIQPEEFDFDSGALCLDFANTVEWHASESPEDRLQDVSSLLNWGEAAGVYSPVTATRLRDQAEREQSKAAFAFDRALSLREAVYRIFTGLSDSESSDPADLAQLNTALSGALGHLRLVPAGAGFDYTWDDDSQDMDQVYRAVAHSAAELLTADHLDRVSQCADDRGCGYLFLDTSRNRSRRWCSMDSCGNRAKAMRHYRRATHK